MIGANTHRSGPRHPPASTPPTAGPDHANPPESSDHPPSASPVAAQSPPLPPRVLGGYWPATLARLAGRGHAAVARAAPATPVPPYFALRHGLSGGAAAPVLRFHDLDIPGIGTLRATDISGPRAEIFNAMLFPARPDLLPVFASEVVVFAGKVRVGVVDLQPLHGEALHHRTLAVLAPVAARFAQPAESADLPPGGDLPDWALAHFTPHAIHTRPPTPPAAGPPPCPARLLEAHLAYLDAWLDLTDATPGAGAGPETDDLTPQTALADYKHHHVLNTPGLPYLGKMFGVEWTERFLAEAMYA